MEDNGYLLLHKVLELVKNEYKDDVPLVRFVHPKQLKEILNLDVTKGVNDKELEECISQVLEYCVKTNKGTFRNQLDGGVDPNGLAGAWLAEAFNTSQYTYEVAPAFTLIELQIIEHVLKKFGIPDGDGIFSPGGSVSMLYAITTARFHAFPQVKTKGIKALPEMIIFSSEDSHYSVGKAAHWLGFGTDSVRLVRVNEHGQMLTDELEVAIKDELTHGRHPLFVNATAGTTVLGAIDDLERVADVCQKYHVWMHVDSHIVQSTQAEASRANSISWNPHKMVGAPLHCSLFLVREKELLYKCNSASAQYLFQADKFYDTSYDTGDKSVQCGHASVLGRSVIYYLGFLQVVADVGHSGLRVLSRLFGPVFTFSTCLVMAMAFAFRLSSHMPIASETFFRELFLHWANLTSTTDVLVSHPIMKGDTPCPSQRFHLRHLYFCGVDLFHRPTFSIIVLMRWFTLASIASSKAITEPLILKMFGLLQLIDAFKLWTIWKARGDSGLSNLLDHTMKNAQFCMETLATKAGFRLVSPKLQCPSICFWYIPACMRGQQENDKWWGILHKVTADIKELLMVDARLMIAYSPLRQHRNFFRLALTFHPVLQQKDIVEMLRNIEECGEIIGSRLTHNKNNIIYHV
ncbi:Glutamate decarboxylase 1 [Eumeta japonica]|uniref:Glutamate decarboxylase 1 n=1 Tax=Eumeta variegata TaxID=151549 RepID=A0A4C1UKM0_EUMVA|nr:Glutamate decarboxylase 1 [Eumeta japonica]